MKSVRRGISPVIATVIIVAVAIAISIAVAGWLMGLWGTFGTTEQLTIMPDTTLNATASPATLTLHVKNTGSKSAVVIKIEVVGVGTASQNGLTVSSAGSEITSGVSTVTIPQGADYTIIAPLTGSATAGTQYLIKVYTASGNVYQGYVVASS
jgi:flagellin-like protein